MSDAKPVDAERIQDISDAHMGRLTYLKMNGFRLSRNDEQIRDLLGAISERDAALKACVEAINLCGVPISHSMECSPMECRCRIATIRAALALYAKHFPEPKPAEPPEPLR